MRHTLKITAASLAAIVAATSADALVIKLEQISTPFSSPIGIDYYEPLNQVLVSANYPSGLPSNFELIAGDGTRSAYSGISGLTDEIKVATARSVAKGGCACSPFAVGTAFTGNGIDGQIVKIDPGGGTSGVFVDFDNFAGGTPGGHGLIRGSMYVDRTGAWGGDLLAVTTGGEVWRIDGAGTASFLADVGVHLEGLMSVPNDPIKYGGLAGKLLAGAEGQGRLYVIDTDGSFTFHTLGVNVEDIDFITGTENFFGVNFGTGRILGSAVGDWASAAGDILLTQEFPFGGTSGLYLLKWDAIAMVPMVELVLLSADSAVVGQWEHVTFAAAGIREIPPIGVPEPAVIGLLGLGLLVAAARRRRS